MVEITGAAFVYALDGPDHIRKEFPPPKELDELFPGMRRILREAHVRYVFERFGVPYVRVHPMLRSAARRTDICRAGKPIRSP